MLGPSDVGSNDIWTVARTGHRSREAIDLGCGELPNFHAYQLRDVIGAIRDKRPPAVTGVDGRRVVAIIQGVYESGRTSRPVKLARLMAKLRIAQIGTNHGHAMGKWKALQDNPDVEAVALVEPADAAQVLRRSEHRRDGGGDAQPPEPGG